MRDDRLFAPKMRIQHTHTEREKDYVMLKMIQFYWNTVNFRSIDTNQKVLENHHIYKNKKFCSFPYTCDFLKKKPRGRTWPFTYNSVLKQLSSYLHIQTLSQSCFTVFFDVVCVEGIWPLVLSFHRFQTGGSNELTFCWVSRIIFFSIRVNHS